MDGLNVRLWQACHAASRSDATLLHDLDAAAEAEPKSAAVQNALGLALSLSFRPPNYEKVVSAIAADHFEKAVAASPNHLVARLNLAEALRTAGDEKGAIEQCRNALTLLER